MRAALTTSVVAFSLAACGGGGGRPTAKPALATAAHRAPAEWTCIRIEDVTDGPGLTALEYLEDAGLAFYKLPASVLPPPRPGTRCVGLFEQPDLATETLARFDDEVVAREAVRLQRLTAGQLAALPAPARALAWVSAPLDFTGDESAGPLELERTPDGRTVILFVQDSERGDFTEGRLYVLNERVGRVEVFAAWDFVLAGGRLFYGTARLLSDSDTPARQGEAVASRDLGVTTAALRAASFFDRSTASTQVVSLATYDPGSGRAVELGQLGGGTLALADGRVVAAGRPLWWELSHADDGASDGDAVAALDVWALGGRRLEPLDGNAGTVARRALLDKLHSRERSLAEGSAAVGAEAQKMLSDLAPPETGTRRLGNLVISDGEVGRKVGTQVVRLFEGQLRALTRSGRYGFARLASGRYVAIHFLEP